MNINGIKMIEPSSEKDLVGIVMLKKSMDQNGQAAVDLINGMKAANAKVAENSVFPNLGANIDITV